MIYVISSKNVYAAKRLASEASIKNYELRIVDIADLAACDFQLMTLGRDVLYIRNPYLNGRPDYLPQIIKLAKNFKGRGGRVVDGNIANGDLGLGKWRDYQKLKKAKLPIPKTRLLSGYPLHTTSYPLVLKWIYGMKAKGIFRINSQIPNSKFQNIIGRHPLSEWMRQEYIEADYEYKIITVGYKALPVILRFKFNKNLGGVDFNSFVIIPTERVLQSEWRDPLNLDTRYDKVDTRVKGSLDSSVALLTRDDKVNNLIKLAERASKTLGRELAKVDILEKEGRFYILEVNRFPGLKSFENLTGSNIFGSFVEYLAALQKSSNPL